MRENILKYTALTLLGTSVLLGGGLIYKVNDMKRQTRELHQDIKSLRQDITREGNEKEREYARRLQEIKKNFGQN